MARNLGQDVSTTYDGLGYAFDKVVFQKGKPLPKFKCSVEFDIGNC